jgi:hypothetical protein
LAVPVAPAVRIWPRLRPCFSETCLVTGPADSERASVVDVNAAVASSPGNSWPASGVLVAALTRTPTPPRVRSRAWKWFCNDRVSYAAAGGVFAPTADTCWRVFSKPEHVMCNDGSWLLWMSATAMLPEMVSQTDHGEWNCSSPAPFDPTVCTCVSVTPSWS